MSNRPEKNSERVEVRTTYSLKQRFLKACKTAGDTPSEALRGAMADYILRVEAAGKPNPLQELTMKLIHNPLKTAGMALTSLAAFALIAAPGSADERLFNALDSDGDGLLTEADSGAVKEVVPVLDRNQSNSVTMDEFKTLVVSGREVLIEPDYLAHEPEDWSDWSGHEREAYVEALLSKTPYENVVLESTLVTMDLSQVGKVRFTKRPMPETEYGSPAPYDIIFVEYVPQEKE